MMAVKAPLCEREQDFLNVLFNVIWLQNFPIFKNLLIFYNIEIEKKNTWHLIPNTDKCKYSGMPYLFYTSKTYHFLYHQSRRETKFWLLVSTHFQPFLSNKRFKTLPDLNVKSLRKGDAVNNISLSSYITHKYCQKSPGRNAPGVACTTRTTLDGVIQTFWSLNHECRMNVHCDQW